MSPLTIWWWKLMISIELIVSVCSSAVKINVWRQQTQPPLLFLFSTPAEWNVNVARLVFRPIIAVSQCRKVGWEAPTDWPRVIKLNGDINIALQAPNVHMSPTPTVSLASLHLPLRPVSGSLPPTCRHQPADCLRVLVWVWTRDNDLDGLKLQD